MGPDALTPFAEIRLINSRKIIFAREGQNTMRIIFRIQTICPEILKDVLGVRHDCIIRYGLCGTNSENHSASNAKRTR